MILLNDFVVKQTNVYINEFESMLNKTTLGTTMSEDILVYRLLKSANA